MRAFLEEYGVAILVMAVVFILIAMVSPLGDIILDGFKGIFANLTDVSGSGSSNSNVIQETTTATSHFVKNFMM